MAKEVLGYIKLQIPAGSANPAPPVGPALGQKGLNIQIILIKKSILQVHRSRPKNCHYKEEKVNSSVKTLG